MKRLLAIAALALLGGCATSQRIAALENEPPATERQIAERQALLSGKRQMQPSSTERYDIAVVGGSCAPKVEAKFAVTACVNERPCNGHGLRLPDGSVVCACYEVRGGCEPETFCHQRTRTCTKLPAATYHVQ